MRQVFWLNLILAAFPWRESRHSGKEYQDVSRSEREGYYSYGDSAGINRTSLLITLTQWPGVNRMSGEDERKNRKWKIEIRN